MQLTEQVIEQVIDELLYPADGEADNCQLKVFNVLWKLLKIIHNDDETIKHFGLEEIKEEQENDNWVGGLVWTKPDENGVLVHWGNGLEVYITKDHLYQIFNSFNYNDEINEIDYDDSYHKSKYIPTSKQLDEYMKESNNYERYKDRRRINKRYFEMEDSN